MSRWDDPAKFRDVIVALAAVDQSLRTEAGPGESEEEVTHGGDRPRQTCAPPPLDGVRGARRSVFEVFRRRATRDVTFTDVTLTAANERSLSDALTQQLVRDEAGRLVMPTLRYAWPAQQHSGTVAPAVGHLTADQRAQNAIFLRHCRTMWREAQREARTRLGRALADAGAVDRNRAAAAGLRALGIGQLAAWVETDSEIQRVAARDAMREREEKARVTRLSGTHPRQALFPRTSWPTIYVTSQQI